jgi:RNA polymerase sigma-70 factor, ECF subfamily
MSESRISADDDENWGLLMAAAQAGDGAAYARLLRAVVPFVRTIVRHHHRAPDRAEDVVQDVLLCVHRVRHTYDPRRPFANWIGAIAQRRSVDALRRRTRIERNEGPSEGSETFADPRANRDIEARDNEAELAEAIAALPAGQKLAVELLRLRELSLAEASRLSGQSEGALKVSLHRAIHSLRKFMIGRDHGTH